MRVAILTDIHANLPALEAVLEACAPYDAVWVMGDVVGYGPYPDDVIARLRKEHAVAVRGNHDAAVLGELDTSVFNEDARLAVEWTADRIGTSSRHWLEGLPETRVEADFTLAHGSPRDPLWEYLITVPLARRNFSHFETRHAIVGHTHVPRVFRDDGGHIEVIAPREGSRIVLDERRCILNPGWRRPATRRRPARLRHDPGHGGSSTVEWLRVPYPVERVQARMRRAGLPSRLAERLSPRTADRLPSTSLSPRPVVPFSVVPETSATPVYRRAVLGLNGSSADPLVIQAGPRAELPRHRAGRAPRGRGRLAPRPRRGDPGQSRPGIRRPGHGGGCRGTRQGRRCGRSCCRRRDVGAALVDEAVAIDADVILLGLPYRTRLGGDFAIGRTIPYVFQNAPCRVVVVREAVDEAGVARRTQEGSR